MLPEANNDPILQQDLENIVKSSLSWKNFSGASFLITGATGLVGSAIVRALCCANRILNLGIKINLLIRNRDKAVNIFDNLISRENINLIVTDISKTINIDENIDYIIHTAAITNSKMMVTYPVETILTSINGTKNILEFARKKNVKSVVYLSSMEMYGKTDANKALIKEDDLGYVDVLAVRSCYPESKRLAENICSCYYHEYNVPVKIARLAQTFGAGISKEENRVFAQFARSFINKQDIILHTTGESYGNYCYTSECVEAILFLLLNGLDGEAYNVVNESTNIMIRDMAKMIANMSNGDISVVFDIPKDALKYGYAPSVKLHLSGEKLAKLGWKASINLEEMYKRLIDSMIYTENF